MKRQITNKSVWLMVALTAGISVGTAHAAVTQIEGAGGGGLVPWALLAGDNGKSAASPVASYTFVDTGDFTLQSVGVADSFMHRVEFSLAHWDLGLPTDLAASLGTNNIQANVFGAKLKLLGMSAWLPQMALGVQYKENLDGGLVKSLGAQHTTGTDYYLAVTKVFPVGGKNLLLDGTFRETKANWMGLLGFGGPGHDSYKLQFEGTAGLFLNPQTLAGVEYRTKPNNLQGVGLSENNVGDAFVAYFPNNNLSIVAAVANLGQIATKTDQHAFYLQLQAGF